MLNVGGCLCNGHLSLIGPTSLQSGHRYSSQLHTHTLFRARYTHTFCLGLHTHTLFRARYTHTLFGGCTRSHIHTHIHTHTHTHTHTLFGATHSPHILFRARYTHIPYLGLHISHSLQGQTPTSTHTLCLGLHIQRLSSGLDTQTHTH